MAEPFAIAKRPDLALASIQARNHADLGMIGALLDVEVASRSGRQGDDRMALIGTGPGAWLAVGSGDAGATIANFAQRLSGVAAVFDCSDAYVVYRLSGAGARQKLQSGCSIDLSASSFGMGSAVSTVIAHINAVFWQLDDPDSFDIAIYRSFERSFCTWLGELSADSPR